MLGARYVLHSLKRRRESRQRYSEFVGRSLSRARVSRSHEIRHILITCPHSATDETDIRAAARRDPLSGAIAVELAACIDMPTTCIAATVHRTAADQNRLHGLFTANDMAPRLTAWRKAHDLSRTLHLDVHTFTQRFPTKGWGRGLNIVCLYDNREQFHAATVFAKTFDQRLNGKLPPTKVVPMWGHPSCSTDDASNALIEWSTSWGSLSLLLEIPTVQRQLHCALDSCWALPVSETDLLEALNASVQAIVADDHARRAHCAPPRDCAR